MSDVSPRAERLRARFSESEAAASVPPPTQPVEREQMSPVAPTVASAPAYAVPVRPVERSRRSAPAWEATHRRYTVHLATELIEAVRSEANATGESQSELVTLALERLLAERRSGRFA